MAGGSDFIQLGQLHLDAQLYGVENFIDAKVTARRTILPDGVRERG
jgi:hypothetical protein